MRRIRLVSPQLARADAHGRYVSIVEYIELPAVGTEVVFDQRAL